MTITTVAGVAYPRGLTAHAADHEAMGIGLTYTWANAVAAVASLSGKTIFISDVGAGGGSFWWSDGTKLRPVSGRVCIARASGSLATPLATISGSTGASFALSAITIPPALLIPGKSAVLVSAHIRRRNANATAVALARLGSLNTTSDNTLFGVTSGATNNQDIDIFGRAAIATQTTFSAMLFGSPAAWSNTATVDRSTNFDTSVANYVQLGISSASASDAFDLIDYSVWVEQ